MAYAAPPWQAVRQARLRARAAAETATPRRDRRASGAAWTASGPPGSRGQAPRVTRRGGPLDAGGGCCCFSISGGSAKDEASASLWRTVSSCDGIAARSSSVRAFEPGVGASEASGGGDAARGCLRGRRGAICGASLSSAVSRQTSGLGSRAAAWIGFRASEASRGRLKTSDGSNDASSSAPRCRRAVGALRHDDAQLARPQQPGSLRGPGLASRPSAVTDASARLLGQHDAHAAGD